MKRTHSVLGLSLSRSQSVFCRPRRHDLCAQKIRRKKKAESIRQTVHFVMFRLYKLLSHESIAWESEANISKRKRMKRNKKNIHKESLVFIKLENKNKKRKRKRKEKSWRKSALTSLQGASLLFQRLCLVSGQIYKCMCVNVSLSRQKAKKTQSEIFIYRWTAKESEKNMI